MGIAAYKVTGGTKGKAAVVLFEVAGGRAAVKGDVRKLHDVAGQLEPIAALAKSALDALKIAEPNKVELEFGFELGWEGGLPLVTKGSAKANLKVVLTWQKPTGGGG